MGKYIKSIQNILEEKISLKPRNGQLRRLHQLRGHLQPQGLLTLYESARSESLEKTCPKTREGSKQTNHGWSLNQTNNLSKSTPTATTTTIL
jgi:hypothetical protein